MAVALYEPALDDKLEALAKILFGDRRIRSVGIGWNNNAYCFRAVRNSDELVSIGTKQTLRKFADLEVIYEELPGEIESFARIPGNELFAAEHPEQQLQRPLCLGLEIQNFDHDNGTGLLQHGRNVGSLGCFVQNGKNVAILSNNHIIAGENDGHVGTDRILQNSATAFSQDRLCGSLSNFVPLEGSAPHANFADGNAILNTVDAAIANIHPGVDFLQRFHNQRPDLPEIVGVTAPMLNQQVLKVGRSTGLTHGRVVMVNSIVGPVNYGPGFTCWFRRTFRIEGDGGTAFASRGDSGAAVITPDGRLVGIIFSGSATQTYACTADEVLNALAVQLI